MAFLRRPPFRLFHSDPARPDLFYHLLRSNSYALSFLSISPPSSSSHTIIGWLSNPSQLSHFEENPKFRDILHNSIQNALRNDVDDIIRNSAVQTQQGWMHIHDNRNLPPLGRIGDVDDIIASVLVENGKIQPDTYQPMPSYRLCTHHGILQLTPGLMRSLCSSLTARHNVEKNTMA